uniref:Uncharacterized protein n=1 Tax=Oryza rufipogon TaxID=4529 RepID=A0A0E0PXM4_ORYRU
MATTVELDGDGADSGWRWSCAGISGSDGEVHGTEAGCGEPTGDGRRGRGWRRQDVDFMEVDHVLRSHIVSSLRGHKALAITVEAIEH